MSYRRGKNGLGGKKYKEENHHEEQYASLIYVFLAFCAAAPGLEL